jgi:hypothetical protein
MFKIVEAGSWDGLASQGITHILPFQKSGAFSETDRRMFARKTAASEKFLHEMRNIKLGDGDIPVHVNAIGAAELYSCFVAGTPVAMADGRYIPIETVRVGDEVLSADGFACPASAVMTRHVGETLELDVYGLAAPLRCSLNHPFRVASPIQVEACGDEGIFSEWREASAIQPGDFLVWTRPMLPAPKDLLNANYRYFLEYLSAKEFINPGVCRLPRRMLRALLSSYIVEHGKWREEKAPKEAVTLHILNESFSLGLQRLFWAVGVVASLSPNPDGGLNLSLSSSQLYSLQPDLYTEEAKAAVQVPEFQNGFYCVGCVYLPVQSIRKAGAAEVYNLEVAGDHSYSASNVDCHNCNRKGDAFSEQTCRDWHHTFVTEGRNYIHHKNSDPDYNFGKIASACYNEDMHRIELLVVTNGNEAAAKRNGGHVLPDKFLSLLEKNAEVPVSMGCDIREDVCSICGNRARRIYIDYCDENTCRDPKTGEYFPGCKHGLGKTASDGRQQFVWNIEPHFFDISFVGMPADRTGYGFRADYLDFRNGPAKTASLEETFPERFFLISPEAGHFEGYQSWTKQILSKLAGFERECLRDKERSRPAYGVQAIGQNPLLGMKIAGMLPQRKAAALRVLAESGILLSPENFVRAFGQDKTAAFDLYGSSSGVFSRVLQKYDSLGFQVPASVLASLDVPAGRKEAGFSLPEDLPEGLLEESHLTPQKIASHVFEGTLRYHTRTRHLAGTGTSPGLAEAFVLYKTAALCRFPREEQEQGIRTAVWQTLRLA